MMVENYGEDYEGLIVPMLRIPSYQKINKKDDLHLESLERGKDTCDLVLKKQEIKGERRNAILRFKAEFLESLYHMYSFKQMAEEQLTTVFELSEIVKELKGLFSMEYADTLYLKAKACFTNAS